MRALRVLLGTLIGFIAVENLLFNTGAYARIVSTASSTGRLELILWNEHKRPIEDRNQVLTIGDSRMGFFPRYANLMQLGYTFATVAVPGSTPRCWYYLLRDADPHANRYRAVVIALNNYDDEETYDDHADYESDLHYLIARLRYHDLFEFARSYRSPEHQWKAAAGILLKGTVYKTDFQDLLLHRAQRLADADLARRESSRWFYDYVGPADNVDGVKIDWDAKRLELPPNVPASQQGMFEGKLLVPRAPESGRRTAYMKYWLDRIYDHYRGSGTRLIFIRLPRGPYLRRDAPRANPDSSVHRLAAQPDVILDSETTFESLENPRLFLDVDHLNGPGCEQFSKLLALRVRELLGPAN